jgi:RNA polymerase sigma-70 factor (ECF subfamily)
VNEEFGPDLIERLKTGDERAFDVVYEAYRHRLFAYLIRLTRNRDVAEDLLEETWLRFVDRLETIRDGAKLGSWLFAVARNLFLTHVRSLGSDIGGAGEWDEPADQAASPFDAVAASELAARVERGLAAMPVSYREALLLVGVHGMTPSEAAAVCDLTPDAMRQRLLRARKMLAWWLGARDDAKTNEGRHGERRA